jgi:MATE family multidrug resistance protein
MSFYRFSTYKEHYRANLKLALPVVLSQVGQILVQFADNAMVGRYGGDDPLPLAAVSFGGSVFFILFITGLGIAQGLTPLVGEQFARGEQRAVTTLFKNSVLLYTLLGIAIALVQLAIIPLMYHMGQPREVVDQAVPYYRLLVLSMPPTMLFFAFKQFLEGVGDTVTTMIIVLTCNLANILLNWVFIYGHWGAVAWGATGAGIATLLARVAMPVAAILYFYRHRRLHRYVELLPHVSISKQVLRRLVAMGIPISGQMFLESSAFVMTSIMMGWFDAVAIGANQIALTMGNVAFMIVTAIGTATTIRISHCYGARSFTQMRHAAHAGLHIVVAWNLIAAISFILLRHTIPLLFTSNAQMVALTSSLLVVVALYQLSDGLQNVSLGILRGVQDVRVILPLATMAYWILNIPVGYVCGFVWGMGAVGLYVGYVVGLTVAALLYLLRVHRDLQHNHASSDDDDA